MHNSKLGIAPTCGLPRERKTIPVGAEEGAGGLLWGVMLRGLVGCEWWNVSSSLGCGLMPLTEQQSCSHMYLCFPNLLRPSGLRLCLLWGGIGVDEEL